jgi:alanyl-tRNA synthetase
VVPDNEMQGYIVRQPCGARSRRLPAGKARTVVHRLVPTIARIMHRPYPELAEIEARVSVVIKAEEEYFLRTVTRA